MLQRARDGGAAAVQGSRLDFVVAEAHNLRSVVRLVIYADGVVAGAVVRGSQVLSAGQRFSATISSVRTEQGIGGSHLVFWLADLSALGFAEAPVRKGQHFVVDGRLVDYLAPLTNDSRCKSLLPNTTVEAPKVFAPSQKSIKPFSPKKERRVAFGSQARRLLADASVVKSRRTFCMPPVRPEMVSGFEFEQVDMEKMLVGVKSILNEDPRDGADEKVESDSLFGRPLGLESVVEPAHVDIDMVEPAHVNIDMVNVEKVVPESAVGTGSAEEVHSSSNSSNPDVEPAHVNMETPETLHIIKASTRIGEPLESNDADTPPPSWPHIIIDLTGETPKPATLVPEISSPTRSAAPFVIHPAPQAPSPAPQTPTHSFAYSISPIPLNHVVNTPRVLLDLQDIEQRAWSLVRN